VITVKNDSDQATSIQIQVVAWSQLDGKDVYAPSRELLVAPPIVTIAPNSEQILRAALRRQTDATGELCYRIYLQELPPPPAPGFKGLQVALRIGLPVFVQPQHGKAAAKMIWAASRMPGGVVKIELQNQGNAHVQVSDFALYLPGSDKPIAREAGSTYVLAGQLRAWLLKTDVTQNTSGGSLRLKAYTDAGDVDAELAHGPP
jgi:fimbrial chaperone protein